jgi:hypothetical protein
MMRMKTRKPTALLMMAVLVLSAVGCDRTETGISTVPEDVDRTVLGEGKTEFLFDVIFEDGSAAYYEIYTNETTIGEALEALSLVSGDETQYGLYVKYVDGVRADYDLDGKYWAFYIDGEYAVTGVDSTSIQDGSVYTFQVQ